MKRYYFPLLIILFCSGHRLRAQLPRVSGGRIERLEQFQSGFVIPRTIDIWLPDHYSDTVKHAVLYMHDGQMLFDAGQSWNKQSWDLDETATRLLQEKTTRPFIVVGIWNSGAGRHPDYFPQKPYEKMSRTEKDSITAQLQRAGRTTDRFVPRSDNYLRFIVQELKPYIDKKYAVYTGREHTFIAGSSMGGLISLYALCEYPGIFGAAACLSTHWPGSFTPEYSPAPKAFLRYLRKKLPDPGTHRIYFDCGDQTLDQYYPAIQKQADSLLRRRGYTEKNWMTRYFPGEDHSEDAWKRRLHIPLVFLLQ